MVSVCKIRKIQYAQKEIFSQSKLWQKGACQEVCDAIYDEYIFNRNRRVEKF